MSWSKKRKREFVLEKAVDYPYALKTSGFLTIFEPRPTAYAREGVGPFVRTPFKNQGFSIWQFQNEAARTTFKNRFGGAFIEDIAVFAANHL